MRAGTRREIDARAHARRPRRASSRSPSPMRELTHAVAAARAHARRRRRASGVLASLESERDPVRNAAGDRASVLVCRQESPARERFHGRGIETRMTARAQDFDARHAPASIDVQGTQHAADFAAPHRLERVFRPRIEREHGTRPARSRAARAAATVTLRRLVRAATTVAARAARPTASIAGGCRARTRAALAAGRTVRAVARRDKARTVACRARARAACSGFLRGG